MNNVMTLVGRLVKDIEPTQENCSRMIVIAVNRNYKNKDGIYETDFIDVELSESMANTLSSYCFKGDLIGVRGRIETYYTTDKHETKMKHHKVVADKVTFLSSSKANISEVE